VASVPVLQRGNPGAWLGRKIHLLRPALHLAKAPAHPRAAARCPPVRRQVDQPAGSTGNYRSEPAIAGAAGVCRAVAQATDRQAALYGKLSPREATNKKSEPMARFFIPAEQNQLLVTLRVSP